MNKCKNYIMFCVLCVIGFFSSSFRTCWRSQHKVSLISRVIIFLIFLKGVNRYGVYFHANHYNFTASTSFRSLYLYLWMCVLASRSLTVGVVLPLWQPEGVLEGGLSGWVGWADWLLTASLFCPASFSLARPLCSARRISKSFFRPGTVRRWVKECVCIHNSIFS